MPTERENITSEQLSDLKALWMSALDGDGKDIRRVLDRIPSLVAEIEHLRAEKIELNEGIRELQREICARDGVPMPSERPVVDKLRAEIERLSAMLERVSHLNSFRELNDILPEVRTILGKEQRNAKAV